MSRNLVAPRFPNPPAQYDPKYFADFVRAFANYQQQQQNPGDGRFTTVTITNLPTSSTGLPSGALYNDGGFVKVVP